MLFSGWREKLIRPFDASGMLTDHQHVVMPGAVNELREVQQYFFMLLYFKSLVFINGLLYLISLISLWSRTPSVNDQLGLMLNVITSLMSVTLTPPLNCFFLSSSYCLAVATFNQHQCLGLR